MCIHGWLPGDSADLGAPNAPDAVVSKAEKVIRPLDILVAAHAHDQPALLEEFTAVQINRHFAINVRGTLLLIQAWAAWHNDALAGASFCSQVGSIFILCRQTSLISLPKGHCTN